LLVPNIRERVELTPNEERVKYGGRKGVKRHDITDACKRDKTRLW
jgi:hypothetical protein